MPRAILIDKESPFFGEHCALCKNTFVPGEEIIVCAECGTRHHTFCWQEVGNHCTAYGCNGHGEVIRPNRHRHASSRPNPAATAAAVATATTIDPPQEEIRPAPRPARRRSGRQPQRRRRRERVQPEQQQTVIANNAATDRVPWHMRWAQSCLIISIAIAILLFGFGCFGLWAIADYLLLDVFDMPYRAIPQNALPTFEQMKIVYSTVISVA